MKQSKISINNESGMHARPTTQFVSEALKYQSEITIRKENQKEANGKSVMGILALGIGGFETIELKVSGSDEELAFNNLKQLLEMSLVK